MIESDVYFYGLTRTQERNVIHHISKRFNHQRISEEGPLTDEAIQKLVTKSWISFIDPRKLSCEELTRITKAQRYAICHSHMSKVVFTERLTREQNRYDVVGGLRYDHFRHSLRYYRSCSDIFEARELYSNNVEAMKGMMFGDDWYLLTIYSTGESILSLSVAHMVGYRTEKVETLYIKQDRPFYQSIINKRCEGGGITREEAVEYLMSLPAPIIVNDDRHDIPFLQRLFRLCGQQFDLPVLGMRALLALVLSHRGMTLHSSRTRMLSHRYSFSNIILPRRYERTEIDLWTIADLYETTLSVFENLEQRYNVYGIDDLIVLYDTIAPNE